MSQENVEIVTRVLAAINDHNLDAAFEDIASRAELDWSGSEAPDSGVYRGHESLRGWLLGRMEGFAALRFDPTEVIDVAPETVITVAHLRGRGRASGIEVDALGAAVWRLQDGVIVHLALHQTRDAAVKAAGLEG